jgi:hypothetical protein
MVEETLLQAVRALRQPAARPPNAANDNPAAA